MEKICVACKKSFNPSSRHKKCSRCRRLLFRHKCLDCDNLIDTRSIRCYQCHKANIIKNAVFDPKIYWKNWYANVENRQRHIDKARVNSVRRIKSHQDKICEYLVNHPCIDCGEKDIIVLEFDHRDASKEIEISKAIRMGWQWDRIILEIKKCDIRCANCHRRKTAKQFGYYKSIRNGLVA